MECPAHAVYGDGSSSCVGCLFGNQSISEKDPEHTERGPLHCFQLKIVDTDERSGGSEERLRALGVHNLAMEAGQDLACHPARFVSVTNQSNLCFAGVDEPSQLSWSLLWDWERHLARGHLHDRGDHASAMLFGGTVRVHSRLSAQCPHYEFPHDRRWNHADAQSWRWSSMALSEVVRSVPRLLLMSSPRRQSLPCFFVRGCITQAHRHARHLRLSSFTVRQTRNVCRTCATH